jgi:monofunctional biosynthetic peptidoglycan transglycosylase
LAVTSKKRKKPVRRKGKPATAEWRVRLRLVLRRVAQVFLGLIGLQVFLVLVFAFVNPPTNIYMWSEGRRLGESVRQDWVALDEMSPHMARAAVAAEDADFCLHWGFDLNAIRAVVTSGSKRLRGASTLSQQVAKNVFLWPDRSWLRKALEAETTLMIEMFWSKRRIVEVYVNVAEMDEGVFGAGAAGPWYFGVPAKDLSLLQAARLAAVLPDPKGRSASAPSAFVRERTAAIMDGARTIEADGRDRCFMN